jgi:hypothetical protein
VLIPAVFMGFNIVLMLFRHTCYLQFYDMCMCKIVGTVMCYNLCCRVTVKRQDARNDASGGSTEPLAGGGGTSSR